MSQLDLTVDVGALTLKNPVLTASGTFGYGLEFFDYFDVAQLGGICSKGLSLRPRLGNAPARICETDAGMLNAIGLANVGVEAFCRDKLPPLCARGVTVIANIFATSVEDFAALATRLDGEAAIAALELNVSCPNVAHGGVAFGRDAAAAARVVAAVRQCTALPIWVKMSPEAGDLAAVGKACERAGADALSAINTIRGMSIDIDKRAARLHNRSGGLSGPALRPIAVRMIWELYQAVTIPIIGIGGVGCWQHALEMMLAGASAVQVGSASFVDPCASLNVLEGVRRYCKKEGIAVRELIGGAH